MDRRVWVARAGLVAAVLAGLLALWRGAYGAFWLCAGLAAFDGFLLYLLGVRRRGFEERSALDPDRGAHDRVGHEQPDGLDGLDLAVVQDHPEDDQREDERERQDRVEP